jgi:glycosyltransferase involved in cell wall biosynthesis
LKAFDVPVDRDYLRQSLGVPRNAPLIGTVGRLNAQKAPLDFVHLAARMKQSCSEAHFVWIGDGTLMDSTQRLAQQLGVDSMIRFTGLRSDVIPLLHAMDCFLLTSHWEAFPIVVLEAMASGLPIVANRLPGVDEAVVDGFNGYLCPLGDLEAMQVAVEKVIRNRDLAAQLGSNGKNRILQFFTQERMIQELENIYIQICNGRAEREKQAPYHLIAD